MALTVRAGRKSIPSNLETHAMKFVIPSVLAAFALTLGACAHSDDTAASNQRPGRMSGAGPSGSFSAGAIDRAPKPSVFSGQGAGRM